MGNLGFVLRLLIPFNFELDFQKLALFCDRNRQADNPSVQWKLNCYQHPGYLRSIFYLTYR